MRMNYEPFNLNERQATVQLYTHNGALVNAPTLPVGEGTWEWLQEGVDDVCAAEWGCETPEAVTRARQDQLLPNGPYMKPVVVFWPVGIARDFLTNPSENTQPHGSDEVTSQQRERTDDGRSPEETDHSSPSPMSDEGDSPRYDHGSVARLFSRSPKGDEHGTNFIDLSQETRFNDLKDVLQEWFACRDVVVQKPKQYGLLPLNAAFVLAMNDFACSTDSISLRMRHSSAIPWLAVFCNAAWEARQKLDYLSIDPYERNVLNGTAKQWHWQSPRTLTLSVAILPCLIDPDDADPHKFVFEMELGYRATRDFEDGRTSAGPALLMCMPEAVIIASLCDIQSHEFFQDETFMDDQGQCFLTWEFNRRNKDFQKWANKRTFGMDDMLPQNIYQRLRSIYRRIIDEKQAKDTAEEEGSDSGDELRKLSDEFQMKEWRDMFNYAHPVLKTGLNRYED